MQCKTMCRCAGKVVKHLPAIAETIRWRWLSTREYKSSKTKLHYILSLYDDDVRQNKSRSHHNFLWLARLFAVAQIFQFIHFHFVWFLPKNRFLKDFYIKFIFFTCYSAALSTFFIVVVFLSHLQAFNIWVYCFPVEFTFMLLIKNLASIRDC